MSFHALAWAVAAQPGSAADKLVLLGLADRHNTEHDAAYPSTAWLTEFSGLDRKTVVAALDRLETGGFIKDTTKRVGKTKQIKVYALSMESIPKTEGSQKRNCSVFPGKGSQKRDTDTIKEPIPSGAKAPSGRARAFPPEQDFRVLCVAWSAENMNWAPGVAGVEFERFKDSALSHGRLYRDWLAAWRNWCRSPYCATKQAEEYDPFKIGRQPKVGEPVDPGQLVLRG